MHALCRVGASRPQTNMENRAGRYNWTVVCIRPLLSFPLSAIAGVKCGVYPLLAPLYYAPIGFTFLALSILKEPGQAGSRRAHEDTVHTV